MTPNELSRNLLDILGLQDNDLSANEIRERLQGKPVLVQAIRKALQPKEQPLEDLFPIAASLSTDKRQSFYYRLASEVHKAVRSGETLSIPFPIVMLLTQDALNEKNAGNEADSDDVALTDESGLESVMIALFETEHPALKDIVASIKTTTITTVDQVLNRNIIVERLLDTCPELLSTSKGLVKTVLKGCWDDRPAVSDSAFKIFSHGNISEAIDDDALYTFAFTPPTSKQLNRLHIGLMQQRMIGVLNISQANRMRQKIADLVERAVCSEIPEVFEQAKTNIISLIERTSLEERAPALLSLTPATLDKPQYTANKLRMLAALLPFADEVAAREACASSRMLQRLLHDDKDVSAAALECIKVSLGKGLISTQETVNFVRQEAFQLKQAAITNLFLLTQTLIDLGAFTHSGEDASMKLFWENNHLIWLVGLAARHTSHPNVTAAANDAFVLAVNKGLLPLDELYRATSSLKEKSANPFPLSLAIIEGCEDATTEQLEPFVLAAFHHITDTNSGHKAGALDVINAAIAKNKVDPQRFAKTLLKSSMSALSSDAFAVAAEQWKAWLITTDINNNDKNRLLEQSAIMAQQREDFAQEHLIPQATNNVLTGLKNGWIRLGAVLEAIKSFTSSRQHGEAAQRFLGTLIDNIPGAASNPRLTSFVIAGTDLTNVTPKAAEFAAQNFAKLVGQATHPATAPKNGAKTGTELKAE